MRKVSAHFLLQVISWNITTLRSLVNKNPQMLADLFQKHSPDIVFFQVSFACVPPSPAVFISVLPEGKQLVAAMKKKPGGELDAPLIIRCIDRLLKWSLWSHA